MKIKLIKWEYKNIRSILDLKIDLTNQNKSYPVSLIMMPNGVGKTTTLDLLRAILSGNAVNWSTEEVKSFRPKSSNINSGYFKLDLNLDDRHYYIKLNLNYDSGNAYYQTSRVAAGGITDGYDISESAKRVLSPGFIKRFIFNGELAEEILESKSKEAEEAIKFLYQLDVLEEMENIINKIVDERQRESEKTTASTQTGLTMLKNKKDGYETVLAKLEKEEKKLSDELQKKERRLKEISNDIEGKVKEDEALKKQFEDIDSELKSLEIKLNNEINSVFNLLKNRPFLFSSENMDGLKNLSDKMEELKLPKTTSRQFFNELAEQNNCICGREITEEERNIIKENAAKYLGEDQIGLINAIKTEIRNINESDELEIGINRISDFTKRINDLATEKQRIKTKKAEEGDADIEKLQDEEAKIRKRIDNLKIELDKLQTSSIKKINQYGLSEMNNIYLCKRELKRFNDKYAEATGTVKFMQQAEKTKDYLTNVKKATLDRLKQRIKIETSEKISQIISTEDIAIENIDGYLKLEGKSGASEGQSLAIAYSFLGSLFEGSDHELPFVVDSPAGSLDLDVRREVAKILPRLFEQLVIFITSGERKSFADIFYKQSNENVQYLVIHKERNKDAELLSGKRIFRDYQNIQEEE